MSKINIEKIKTELTKGSFSEMIDAFVDVGAFIREKIDEQKKLIADNETKINKATSANGKSE